MIHAKCSPDKHAYLVDNNKSSTGKVIKRTASLLAISALCGYGIWTFTPVSEEANYKLDHARNSTPIVAEPAAPEIAQKKAPAANIIDEVGHAMAGVKLETQSPDPDIQATERQDQAEPVVAYVAPEFPPQAYAYDDHLEYKFPEGEEQETLILAKQTPKPRTAESIGNGRLVSYTIKSGDTLTRIFSRAELPISQAIKLSKNEAASQLNQLSIGKTLRIYFDENEQWETLEYDADTLSTLIVTPEEGDFLVSQHEKQVEYRTFSAHGDIESSLGVAAEMAEISATVTQGLVDIFKWEIDFGRDLRAGDTFSVVYQKAYIDDQLVADGPILAAAFTTGGRTIEAIRYTDSLGKTAYFQPDGESLRRGFLRTPVKLARITSGFGKRRHPIKKTWKKHLGVDYGARRGSPILATADGVVQYSGKKGGYGNTVILRHGGIYTTLYAHMSQVGKGIRSGKSVTQGQVIGYVGRSGWATGDHLHYEFRVNGKHQDPLKVELPKTLPLAKKEMDTFRGQAEVMLDTLTAIRAAQVATLDSQENTSAL